MSQFMVPLSCVSSKLPITNATVVSTTYSHANPHLVHWPRNDELPTNRVRETSFLHHLRKTRADPPLTDIHDLATLGRDAQSVRYITKNAANSLSGSGPMEYREATRIGSADGGDNCLSCITEPPRSVTCHRSGSHSAGR